jgi:integrase
LVKALTDAACRKYAPAAERRRIRDALSQSLFFVIEPSGHKAWQMRFRTPTGRIGKLTLGPYDVSGHELAGEPQIGQPLTLAAARRLATAVHRERALGKDPIAEHKARRARQRVELIDRSKNTFAAAVRSYVEDYARPKQRRWPETARLLGLRPDDLEPIVGGLVQRWQDRPITEIDGHDLWSAVDEARRHAVPGLAARNKGASEARARALHSALSGLFTWLQRQRRITADPTAGLHPPSAPKPRERVLSSDEIRWFWTATESADAPLQPGAPRPFSPLLRLLLLTGARLNEVSALKREELREDGTWHLPGMRTKNGRPHTVPLPPLARDLIASVSDGDTGLVFTTNRHTPISGWSRMKRRLDAAMLALARRERGPEAAIAPWRLHDLRRTCATGMAELGIAPHIVEAALNHVSGARAGVAGTYNRAAYLDERRAALERWSQQVSGLVSGGQANVVTLAKKARGHRRGKT